MDTLKVPKSLPQLKSSWARVSEPDPFSQWKFLKVHLKLNDRNRARFAFQPITWSQTGTAVTYLVPISWCNAPTPQDRDHVWLMPLLSAPKQWIIRALWEAALIFYVWSARKRGPWPNRSCRHPPGNTACWLMQWAHSPVLGEQLDADIVPVPSEQHPSMGRASEDCWPHSL